MTYPTIMPAITLDFQSSQQLDPRVTFSRSSGATYINSAGLVANAADNEARFDHDPVTGECLGLLLEESRTNAQTNSQVFSSGWNISGVAAVTQDTSIVTPSGSTDLTGVGVVTESSGGTVHQIYPPSSSQVTKTITYSVFAKPNGRNYIVLANSSFTHNLSDGTTSGSASGEYISAKTELLSNGWCRCSVVQDHVNTVDQFRINLSDGSAISYSGDGSSGVYVWGAQEEDGSFLTSYIPTSSSTVTRSADVALITGDNFSSWYNQGEGSFIVTSDRVDGLPDLQFTVMTTDGYRLPEFTFRISGTGMVYTPIIGSYVTSSPVIRATFGAAFDGTGMSSYINGAGNSVANTNIVDTNTTLYLGNYINSASYLLTGHISRLTYYNERLTDTELQTLTL